MKVNIDVIINAYFHVPSKAVDKTYVVKCNKSDSIYKEAKGNIREVLIATKILNLINEV